ncbi:sensor histidine kinase KdpD [uncultured Ruminococcus sp.]|uniref:sensor histidine kinase n=1 Tax=uncultured Ruminococcus sp. TaxID=165186 RepID=UPI0025CEC17F|nr:HAMP domain-containing sensor histidine kinase [uncultured Ruminococcus sp.]
MFGDRKLVERLDKMLEDGINGTFSESDYDETKLSKLECKWLRYLTASKMSLQRTEREQEKLRELLSDISHQTRTPLANILLYTQLLQEQVSDEDSIRLADEIRTQADKLDFLIQALVKTSRLETGTFRLVPREHDIDSVIRSAIEQTMPEAEKKQIGIDHIPESHTARYDSKWTQEALFNILDNAVKYSPPQSRITVSLQAFEMFACISVKDCGIGIAEEDLPCIFGRFCRGRNVCEQKGVGIGLYLSRQIIEGQGGYITAASAEGGGSEFRVFLPK